MIAADQGRQTAGNTHGVLGLGLRDAQSGGFDGGEVQAFKLICQAIRTQSYGRCAVVIQGDDTRVGFDVIGVDGCDECRFIAQDGG